MTNATSETCDVCGFGWDDVSVSELEPRLRAVGSRLTALMAGGHPQLSTRPEPDVWSPVEYTSHIRDVMLNLRDRIIVGVAEDNPSPKAMHGTLRIESGLYAADTPHLLAGEIVMSCGMMARTVATFTAELERPIFYGWPRPATRTLRWVAAQALHEAEHHLADIDRQLDGG